MFDLHELIFRTRALGQSHPFTPRGYRYLNARVAQERKTQPAEELGIWAGNALTVGYCLRCVEEQDVGRIIDTPPEPLPADFDAAASHIAQLIRTDGAEPYLLYPEEHVVAALDHLIMGELERRLGGLDAAVEGRAGESSADITEYLAWWVIKGYALRVADHLVPEPAPQAK
ncbi:MAG TPA: hypothetical protein VM324_15655 [Egibacteraceae bacterium]|nr:hypothetical protein [Egibacteraceae bacterium]